jgi:hypothetical protein
MAGSLSERIGWCVKSQGDNRLAGERHNLNRSIDTEEI